jgi:hypothetical protein
MNRPINPCSQRVAYPVPTKVAIAARMNAQVSKGDPRCIICTAEKLTNVSPAPIFRRGDEEPPPRPSFERSPKPFPARYDTRCPCGETIWTGDLIIWSEDAGAFVHEGCE